MADEREVPGYPAWQITLFLAGTSPRSRRARWNLYTLLYLLDYSEKLAVQEIDVLQDACHVGQNSLVSIPAAILNGPRDSSVIVYGDLGKEAQRSCLVSALMNLAETESSPGVEHQSVSIR